MKHNDVNKQQKTIKFIPQRISSAPEPSPIVKESMVDEIYYAKNSYAYWWFMCLKANDEYRARCKHINKGDFTETYEIFGEVGGRFSDWWSSHGIKAFREKQPLKQVTAITGRTELSNLYLSQDRLILDIPLTMRKQTVVRQINRLLKTAYTGREVDIFKASTANAKFVKSKMRFSTIKLLLTILRLRKRYPKHTLAQIGEKANITLDLLARTTNCEAWDEVDEKRRMTIAVSRYSRQAKNLIDNAARGVFPSIKTIPKESVKNK